MSREQVDVLIVGGGFAGLTLAIALRQSLGPSFSVLVAVLALAAWMLATAPAINLASVLAFACLVALVLGGAALALAATTSALRDAMDDAHHEGGAGSA